MEEVKQKPIKKVLVLADFACATGFAQVSQNIVRQLLLDPDTIYTFDIVGINYNGMPTEWHRLSPQVQLVPAMASGEVFGRRTFLDLLAKGIYDIVFTLQDTFIIEPIAQTILDIRNRLAEMNQKTFRWIFYFPIDATPKENWITKSVLLADYPVVYTKYGYEESIKKCPDVKNKLQIIPHGIEVKNFFPLPDDQVAKFRHEYFAGKADNRFLVTNVNRNQPRKDVARTLKIFADLKQNVPEAFLYLHMKNQDVAYTIDEVARNFDLMAEEDYTLPQNFDEHDGFPINAVNYIYNASDVVITSSLGEGWGLSITEAMACKTPVIAPNHTAITEIIGEDRGFLVPMSKSSNDWVILQMDNERLRPLVSIPDFVEALVQLRNNPQIGVEKAENAYTHLLKYWTWDIVGEQWRQIFKKAGTIEQVIKIGRNDPCPECLALGKTVKYKNCAVHGLRKNG